MTPTYDLVANEGAVHEPIFVYRVVVGEIVATGKGPSKKKAKHVAAQEALERIRQVVASAAGGLSRGTVIQDAFKNIPTRSGASE